MGLDSGRGLGADFRSGGLVRPGEAYGPPLCPGHRGVLGGPLKPGGTAYEECRRRSPASFLENAQGQWPKLLLVHGITDATVPPSHSLRAFNALAAPEDRLPPELLAAMDRTGDVPPGIEGLPSTEERDYQQLYYRAKKPLRFARSSQNVSVELFQGGHDIIFNAGLAWLARQVRE